MQPLDWRIEIAKRLLNDLRGDFCAHTTWPEILIYNQQQDAQHGRG
jgi:hypothetical protein